MKEAYIAAGILFLIFIGVVLADIAHCQVADTMYLQSEPDLTYSIKISRENDTLKVNIHLPTGITPPYKFKDVDFRKSAWAFVELCRSEEPIYHLMHGTTAMLLKLHAKGKTSYMLFFVNDTSDQFHLVTQQIDLSDANPLVKCQEESGWFLDKNPERLIAWMNLGDLGK